MTALARPAQRGIATASVPSPGGGRRQRSLSWLALPALAFFFVFAFIPLVGVIVLSFTSWNLFSSHIPFAGLASWRAVLSAPSLGHSLWVTFLITVISWAFQTPMSLLLGVFLAGRQRYRGFLSVFYILPLLLSSAGIAVTYTALLDPNFGLGAGLHSQLLTQSVRGGWLGDETLALIAVIFIVSWQFIPFHSLIYQGAVRQIPVSMYEAATIDGAGRIRQFFSITVPQLKYTIITSSTLMVVGSLTFFDLIWVLTGGGPNDATRVLAVDMYKQGWEAHQMGQASAIATILIVIGLILALVLRRLGGRDPSASQMEGA